MGRSSGRVGLSYRRAATRAGICGPSFVPCEPSDPVTAELRELKADISELGRSLDGSTITFVSRQRGLGRSQTAWLATGFESPASDGHSSPLLQERDSAGDHDHDDRSTGVARRDPCRARHQGGSGKVQGRGHSSDGWDSCELDIRFPPPPPPPPRSTRLAPRRGGSAGAAAASCCRGVQADYAGVQDVDELVRRVEASARAVSLENDDVVKDLRAEEDKTVRLREALWQEGTAKREWETTTEASRVLKQRLESTERIRKRQQELIRELQAVEADIAFANAGGMMGTLSPSPLPLLSPPLPPLPPPPPPSTGRRKNASPPSLPMRRQEQHEAKIMDILRGAGLQQRQQHSRQGRSWPAGLHPAGQAVFSESARRAELEESSSGDGGGFRGRAPSSGKARAGGTRTTARTTSKPEYGVGGTGFPGRRRGQGSSARRVRTPGDETPAGTHSAKRRQTENGVGGVGGGSGGGGEGRVRCSSSRPLSSARTAEKIDGGSDPSAAPIAAWRSPGLLNRARKKPSTAAVATPTHDIRRSGRKAKATQASTGFGAPTAASSGKDRRLDGVTASEEPLGATPPGEGGRRKSQLSSSARKGGGFYPGKPGCRHEHRGRRPGHRKQRQQQPPPPPPHSLLRGTASSRSRSRTDAARGPASAVRSRQQ